MKPELKLKALCNAKNRQRLQGCLKISFGLRYTACFDLSHTDDVVHVIEGKNI